MSRIPLSAAMALAACSAEPQGNAGAPTPQRAGGAVATASDAAPAIRDSHAKPQPGELKTFRDWAVGCDNIRRCELRSLASETAEPGTVTVSIARDAGPGGAITSSVGSDEQDGLVPSIDGKPADTPAALAARMANGHALAARAAAKVVGSVSLKGASAALRYIDAAQGRAGTVTALVAKGLKPASAVPAGPAAPTIVAVAPGGTPKTASREQLAAMRRAAACDDEPSDKPEFHALGGGRTLVLLACSAGAYNVSEALFVLDGTGFAPAKADAPLGFAETGADAPKVPSVVNGRWENGMLTSHAKGRGIGDCGVDQELVWDGTRLRLSGQREMGECRGNADFITTWRTRVVRK